MGDIHDLLTPLCYNELKYKLLSLNVSCKVLQKLEITPTDYNENKYTLHTVDTQLKSSSSIAFLS